MRVLVVGSGAREHAIAWKIAGSKRNSGLFVAPGNAGTDEIAENLPGISGTDPAQVIEACRKYDIGTVFVGPEVPLSLGLVDALETEGIRAFGPRKREAQLESSKAFSKQFMKKHRIPTAKADIFTDSGKLAHALKKRSGMLVVKKSGLAAGKGVLESDDPDTLKSFALSGLADGPVIVEEFLSGFEISVFAVTDGVSYALLPPCTDYKKAGDENTGPNTGGMGAICPVPWVDSKLMTRVENEIVRPTFEGFRKEGFDYRGIVYFGLMITENGPKLLEFNVRFGDPEAQVLIPLIENDFCNLIEAVTDQKLSGYEIRTKQQTALCVVVASPGYPGEYEKNLETSLPRLQTNQLVFQAGTYRTEGKLYTTGGRCFSAVGIGNEILSARSHAYAAASGISFSGAWYRKDIGSKIFG